MKSGDSSLLLYSATERASRQRSLARSAASGGGLYLSDTTATKRPNHMIDLEFQTLVSASAKLDSMLFNGAVAGRRVYLRKGTAYGYTDRSAGRDEFVGAAAYMELGITTLDASLNLSLPFLAAAATVGSATVNFRLEVIGFTGDMRPFRRKGLFTVENYAATLEKLDEAQQAILVPDDVDPKPIGELIERKVATPQLGVVEDAVAMRFGVRQIALGRSLEQALTAPSNRYLSELEASAVRSTYEAFGVASTAPTKQQRAAAERMLEER